MKIMKRILLVVAAAFSVACLPVHAASDAADEAASPNEVMSEHMADNYWWHITTIKEKHISVYLPVIVRSQEGKWHVFSSKHLSHGETYKGFTIAHEGKYAGKIVQYGRDGEVYRPWDISFTKNAFALAVNSAIMIALFLGVARWYGRRPKYAVPGGFVGAVEMFVMSIEDEVIKQNIGPDYKRYSPYLLTAFFFILINNVLGLIPIFPFGANTTGNIAVTLVLALATMVVVNVFANRHYWKEILWPDVPLWLKPIMIPIEVIGIITKPFALMIRLLANIFAGHTIILSLTFLIFGTVSMGVGINAGMSFFSVLLSIFMLILELLVAYIQAYVFTMLSAVFIGMSRPEHHPKPKKVKKQTA